MAMATSAGVGFQKRLVPDRRAPRLPPAQEKRQIVINFEPSENRALSTSTAIITLPSHAVQVLIGSNL